MRIDEAPLAFNRLPGALPVAVATSDAAQWSEAAQAFARAGDRLVALWASDRRDLDEGFVVHAAYALTDSLACVRLPLGANATSYPDLSAHFPAANRMQRAAFDLIGVRAEGAADGRPWLRHGAWPSDYFPLRRDSDGARTFEIEQERYPFVSVSGDGVHEIPVGPIHAGIIEPGHFRFSVVGEKVLRLEERLGYAHKGIEKRFEGMPLDEGHRLAGRVSGDSTVAYAWAYAIAAESATTTAIPSRAAWLRALLLERERVANHLGDLGALGNDAALGFGLAQFSRLRELWLRANARVFGHRLMMDCIVPGGLSIDPDRTALDDLRAQTFEFETEVRRLRTIYDEHAGLQDRFQTTGIVEPELAAQLGLTGLAGRASGIEARPARGSAVHSLRHLAGRDRYGHPRRRRRSCRRPLRRNRRIAAADSHDRRTHARRPVPRRVRANRRGALRHRLGRRLARRGARRTGNRPRRRRSGAAIVTTRRGRTGRCSSMR